MKNNGAERLKALVKFLEKRAEYINRRSKTLLKNSCKKKDHLSGYETAIYAIVLSAKRHALFLDLPEDIVGLNKIDADSFITDSNKY